MISSFRPLAPDLRVWYRGFHAGQLPAEELADLGQVRGDGVLLPGQLVDLALGRGAAALGVGLDLGEQLLGLGLGLGHDLVGVLLGVGHQLTGVRVGVAAGLVGLRRGLGRALLGGGRALLGLGDQLLRGGLVVGQSLVLVVF
jgi:hypothetical protein